MVVSESGLIRAMKGAYKGVGYKVANKQVGNVEEIMIGAPGWVVLIEKKNMPRKVLGLIAEHVGEIPAPGEAFQVSKKATQTEIFGVSMQLLEGMKNDEKERRLAKRTTLTLAGYPLWQREKDLKIVRVPPLREDIMLAHGRDVWMFDSDTLMVDGKASRVYVDTYYIAEEEDLLKHLSKVAFVTFGK